MSRPRLTRISAAQWRGLASRARTRARDTDLTDRAAALTYYAFLSLLPALLVAVALLALIGTFPETYDSIVSTLRDVAPGPAIDAIDSALRDILSDRGSAASLLGIGLVASLWAASGAVGASLRAISAIHDAGEAPPSLKAAVERLALTIAIMLLQLVTFTALILAGPLFVEIAKSAGLGQAARTAVEIARWPVAAAALVGAILLLYRRGSRSRRTSLRALMPGALAATALWLLASVGFTVYVANFGSYDATYGALGAVIILLVWMWIGGLALLAGAVLNVELARTTAAVRRQ